MSAGMLVRQWARSLLCLRLFHQYILDCAHRIYIRCTIDWFADQRFYLSFSYIGVPTHHQFFGVYISFSDFDLSWTSYPQEITILCIRFQVGRSTQELHGPEYGQTQVRYRRGQLVSRK